MYLKVFSRGPLTTGGRADDRVRPEVSGRRAPRVPYRGAYRLDSNVAGSVRAVRRPGKLDFRCARRFIGRHGPDRKHAGIPQNTDGTKTAAG